MYLFGGKCSSRDVYFILVWCLDHANLNLTEVPTLLFPTITTDVRISHKSNPAYNLQYQSL
ncbi:MAG: hypothetical protein UX64_C0025G0006 [Microgenomates group bacterium GW2011_GWC2_46_7]|nr:MAG: hypothetical protein UX64_C0025G0006 [Microgenomates group bacterium GW2011_GWC2_46_7]